MNILYMIKNLKANKIESRLRAINKAKFLSKNKVLIFLLLIVCAIFICNPAIYAKSCLNAISVWSVKVLPVLFPFFIFTKIIVALIEPKQTKLDKVFFKLYHTPATSSSIFLLSLISGYPMGAKLICNMFERGIYTRQDAKRMLAFCSVSGPMFMIGTVGVAVFGDIKFGVVIMCANVLACLVNGLIFRGKKIEQEKLQTIQIEQPTNNSNILGDSVYDALISILMVGAFMVLAFLLIDVLKNTGILICLSAGIAKVLHIDANFVQAFLSGIVEITRGVIDLSAVACPMQIKLIFASALIGFGGISIFMQSLSFLSKLKIKPGYVMLQKLSQGLLALLFSVPLCFLVC